VDFGTKTDIPKSWGLGGLGGCLAPYRELRRFSGAQQERGHKGPLRGFPPNSSQAAEQEIPLHCLSLWEASRGGWCILYTYVLSARCCAAIARACARAVCAAERERVFVEALHAGAACEVSGCVLVDESPCVYGMSCYQVVGVPSIWTNCC
jgi:hypothetical protein